MKFKDIKNATWFKLEDSEIKRLKINTIEWDNNFKNSVYNDAEHYLNYEFIQDETEVIPIKRNWEIEDELLEIGK